MNELRQNCQHHYTAWHDTGHELHNDSTVWKRACKVCGLENEVVFAGSVNNNQFVHEVAHISGKDHL